MTKTELRKAIITYLMGENSPQRVNHCHDRFQNYIYDGSGRYTPGGKDISDYIFSANNMIYGTM